MCGSDSGKPAKTVRAELWGKPLPGSWGAHGVGHTWADVNVTGLMSEPQSAEGRLEPEA